AYTPKEVQNAAKQIVLDFIANPPPYPTEQLPFYLASKLKVLGTKSIELKNAVKLYCERAGTDFLVFWTDFVNVYEDVIFSDIGGPTLDNVFAEAMNGLIGLPENIDCPGKLYIQVYSLAYHLAVRNTINGVHYPFLLPGRKIGPLMGVRHEAVY